MTNFLTLRGSQTQIRLRTRSPKSKPLISALRPNRSRKSRLPKKTAPPGPPRKKTQKRSRLLRQSRIPHRSPRSNQPTSLIKRRMPATGLKNPMQESVPTNRLVPTPRRNRQRIVISPSHGACNIVTCLVLLSLSASQFRTGCC